MAKPAVVKRLASELDEARRENEKLREDLFRERNDREIEVETERKKREASHKLADKTADDVPGHYTGRLCNFRMALVQ